MELSLSKLTRSAQYYGYNAKYWDRNMLKIYLKVSGLSFIRMWTLQSNGNGLSCKVP